MNVESINPSTWSWLYALPAVIMVAGVAAVILTAMSGRKKTAIGLGVVFLAAFAVNAIAVTKIENHTRAENQAVLISYFEKSYGLKLDEVDLSYLRNVDKAEETRDIETTDGNFKHVLFRVVDGSVVPHLLDSSSTWIPMPAAGETK